MTATGKVTLTILQAPGAPDEDRSGDSGGRPPTFAHEK